MFVRLMAFAHVRNTLHRAAAKVQNRWAPIPYRVLTSPIQCARDRGSQIRTSNAIPLCFHRRRRILYMYRVAPRRGLIYAGGREVGLCRRATHATDSLARRLQSLGVRALRTEYLPMILAVKTGRASGFWPRSRHVV
jgi:hypothetical protein